MKLLAILIVLLAAGCGTVGENGTRVEDVPLQDYRVIPLGGTAVTPDTFVVEVGGGRSIRLNLVNPSPTPTPTFTFTPTATNTPVGVPTALPTATQEVTQLPPLTPGPLKTCEVKAAQTVRIRSAANTSGTIVGSVATNEVITISEVVLGEGYLWARHSRGWSAIRSGTTWWVYGIEGQTETCVDILGWPNNLEPPVPVVRSREIQWGWHILVGSNTAPISSTLNTWGAAKALTESGQSVEGLKRAKPALVSVWRSLFTCMGMTDGPTFQQWDTPQAYYDCMKPYWPAGYDYYEPVNEVGAPRGTGQFTDLMIAIATLAARDGKCILAYSYPAGNPELAEWGEVLRFMRWSNEHPCGNWPSGVAKYHGIALHQSGYMPGIVSPTSWINNSWIAGRDVMIDNQLRQAHGFSLADFKGGIWFTEWGYTDGYSGNWSDTFTCEQLAAGVRESALRYRDRPWVFAVLIWTTVGQGTRWTDSSQCVDEIAAALM